MLRKRQEVLFRTVTELTAARDSKYRWLNERLRAATQACGAIAFSDITVTPELYHVCAPRRAERSGPHQHPFTELSWIEGPAVEYDHGAAVLPVGDGQAVLAPALLTHGWRALKSGSRQHGFLLTIRANDWEGDSLALHLEAAATAVGWSFTPPAEALAALRAAERLAMRETAYARDAAAACLRAGLTLLFDTIRQAYDARYVRGLPPVASPARRLFLRAKAYILPRLAANPSLPEVAAHVGVTPRHLNRVFVAAIGIPAGTFILQTRLSRAKDLLHQPGAVVKAVALECGFGDPAYFTRIFRQRTGVTPAAYARAARRD